MLLTISHQSSPNGGRVPPSLFDLYVQYKQDTRAIIAWLMSNSSGKLNKNHDISVRDLLGLAEVVQRKAVVMPDTIDFQFREAIAARKQLSKFFKTESGPKLTNEDTTNHEFFTESLNKIYTGLCKCCEKPVEDCKRTTEHKDQQLLRNRFAAFKPETTETCCDCESNLTGETERPRKAFGTAPQVSDVPQLINDPLCDAFEIRREFQEMDDLLFVTKEVWKQAGTGEIPLVVAAFLTNVAFARFEGVEQRLKLLCDCSDPEVLRSKVMQMQGTSTWFEAPDGDLGSPATQTIESLQQSWLLLLHLKNSVQATSTECEICVKKTSNVILRLGPDSADADEKCLNMILHNIKQHVQKKCVPTDIVRSGTPLYAEVGYFLTHQENDVNGLRCTFGLHMLLDAYKSFMLACQEKSVSVSCRLQALKVAQEALPSIRAVLSDSSMPCRCYQTLAFHLENLELDLKAFLQEKCFDLYFQSPWVSGSHILEMHETLFYYGLRLFSYRHYVGSVLHVYHVLREFTGFEPVPLLEQLRDTFNDTLFPGGRPSRNFKACCLRYMGGRLRFKPDASDHKSGSHHMAIPSHTAKANAGFGLRKEANDSRFAYCKVSLFYHIKEKGYHADESLCNPKHDLGDLCVTGRDHKGHVCTHDQRNQDFTSNAHPHQLSHLQQAVLTDFTGPFPIARVNFFRVYISCVRIISIVSGEMHAGDDHEGYCLCFLDAMLQAADLYKANEHKLRTFGNKILVNICKEAMSATLGGRGVDDFLWKTI